MVCCVPKCTVNRVDGQRNFPASKYLRQRWIRAIRLGTGSAKALSLARVRNKTICQWHFKHADVQAPTRFRNRGMPTETELAACRLCSELDRVENLMSLEELFIRGVPVVRILATLVQNGVSVHNSIANICARCLAYLDVLYSVQKHFHGLVEDCDSLKSAVALYKAAQVRTDESTAVSIKQELLEDVEEFAESSESWNSKSIDNTKEPEAASSATLEQNVESPGRKIVQFTGKEERNSRIDINKTVSIDGQHITIDGLNGIMVLGENIIKVDPMAKKVDNCIFAVYKGLRDTKLATTNDDDAIIAENHLSTELVLMDMGVSENSSIDCSAEDDMMTIVETPKDSAPSKRCKKARKLSTQKKKTEQKPVARRRGRKPKPKPAEEELSKQCYGPDADVTCYLCYQTFENATDMIEHLTEHSERDLRCEPCKKSFHNILHLNRHLAKHDPLTRPYKCNYCEIRYATFKSQRRHERQLHSCSPELLPPERKKPKLVCHQCGKQFSSKCTLRDHEDLHLGIKRFSCDVCGMQFRNRSIRERHKLAHTSVVMYRCDVCGRGFRQSTVYKDHLRYHAKDAIYQCNLCDAVFTSTSNLRRHKIRTHYKMPKHTVDVVD